jgi:hypothetical protein
VRRQNTVIEHQASPADAAHTPVRIDARVRKRQHVASHARRFLASHRTNNTARTTSNQAHLGMRLECSPRLADTSARSPRLCRGLVSSPGHNAHASAPFISRSSDSEGYCSAVDLRWVYATVASHQTWRRPGHGDSTFEPSLLTSTRSRPRSMNPPRRQARPVGRVKVGAPPPVGRRGLRRRQAGAAGSTERSSCPRSSSQPSPCIRPPDARR